ncbi:MAG: Phosphodiesterase/alkaline phosphatase D [Cytophagales bacterium]|jgi:alkaline phosphatase D|nr:alkaline phosphatase D family protein [Bacteroidota bacterium]MBS1981887.1 alkaline phosphatase D family protein [Bacteroidota bacterium]WHZ07510.1 MAG: Phosphodiesterase/alkaline phosphatase D [Cytophagales bacterium]
MKLYQLIFYCSGVILFSCGTEKKDTYQEAVSHLVNVERFPFYHGVASGDPLTDRVILWTRVTPEDPSQKISVTWQVSDQKDFSSILKSDTLSTSSAKDFTVKVDATGLQAGMIYYYRFMALGKTSEIGQTKTLPANPDRVKLAVVSCANWEWGFFTPYEKVSLRTDIDAVIHLGDFIYEYASGKYGDTTIGRINIPKHELVSLQDYRERYSQYRLDKGLHDVSLKLPMIAIWDDHEIANDSYVGGAQNHQPEEGDYANRKAAARKAYYEWIPIREGQTHYRTFSFGKLADLIMLDERLAGKQKQATGPNDLSLESESRTMLGQPQVTWLETQLKNSSAQWRIIGNQVIFSDVSLKPIYPQMPRNFDSWDGYPMEKRKLKNFILENKIKNLIFITGDAHSSWAIEAATDVKKTYSPFAVELVTTSISSANGNEYAPDDSVKVSEQQMLKINPHVKYLNNRDHGYMLLTLTREKAKAEWWFVETVRVPDAKEFLGKSIEVHAGEVKIRE